MDKNQHWVSVWGNAVSVAENRPERYAKDITIRYPVHVPFSGSAVRLRHIMTQEFSNRIALLIANITRTPE